MTEEPQFSRLERYSTKPCSVAELRRLRRDFLWTLMIAGGLFITVQIIGASLPKSSWQQQGVTVPQPLANVVSQLAPPGNKPHPWLRKILVFGYFGSLSFLCYVMTGPRSTYMKRMLAWQFENCPRGMEQTWKLYLFALDEAINPAAYVVGAFVATTGMRVLSCWFPGSALLDSPVTFLWWISLIALVLLPFVCDNRFSSARQQHRLFKSQVMTSSFVPRTSAELGTATDFVQGPPVEVVDALRFQAGGMVWHWEDFIRNAVVFGQVGTGKTLCVLNALLDGLLGSGNESPDKPSALILDPKGDFSDKIQHLCRKYNREDDLRIIDPKHPDRSFHWNPLDSDDDELELAARFVAALETLAASPEKDAFWMDSARKFIRHAIRLIRLTNPPGEPPTLADIGELASSFDAIVERTDRMDPVQRESGDCLSFFANEWVEQADETRTSIQSHITNMVDPFLMPPYDSLFAGRSDESISRILSEGKILYVNTPIAEREMMARVVCTLVKLEYFREVLKSVGKPRLSFFLCDEFQSFFTAGQNRGDAEFFERSRQSNHANIIATQNIHALLKQTPRENPVKNLLGNCAAKIFLRNTDFDTNKYASQLFGEITDSMPTRSGAGGGGGLRGSQESGGITFGAQARYSPESFVKLATPSRSDGADYCHSLVHLASRGTVSDRLLTWRIHPLGD